jgi:hypothetical protein
MAQRRRRIRRVDSCWWKRPSKLSGCEICALNIDIDTNIDVARLMSAWMVSFPPLGGLVKAFKCREAEVEVAYLTPPFPKQEKAPARERAERDA